MENRLERAPGDFAGCFGCGPENPVGLRLEFQRNGEEVVARATLDPAYAGYEEFCHGGVVATLLDEAMGWAMLHVAGRYGVTRELRVEYRRPVYVGRPVVVRARLLEVSPRGARLESTIEDARGRRLARAEGDWAAVRKERANGAAG